MPKPESILRQQIAEYMQLRYPNTIYRFDLAADMKLTAGQAARHKHLHPLRGYPDMFIAKPREDKHGLFVELKAEKTRIKKKDGSWASPHIAEQATVLEKLNRLGYAAEFGVGFPNTRKIIDEYMRGEK